MDVKFWGVRGSIAVSGPDFAATGGNTACIAVQSQGHLVVLDAGTGLRALGAHLGFVPMDMTLCFSHVHWDHIQGVPFFAPLFHPDSRIRILGARRDGAGIRDTLEAQLRPPVFPITLDKLRAQLQFDDVAVGEALEVGPFRLRTCEVQHPDGALAWRIEADGRSFVYATDVENADDEDAALLRFCEGVDLLAHDAQYTDEEYASRRGWGHSTWKQAVSVGSQAHVRRLALIHHDPMRDDAAVDRIEAAAQAHRGGIFSAREGMSIAV
jgi:phosphoribosyl 1,2-cyclic phosphodiesterase